MSNSDYQRKTKVGSKNLKMLEWLKIIEKNGELTDIPVSNSYLRLIAYGHKRPSAKVATAIEIASKGYITRKELRPIDWQDIWPELI